MCALLVCAHSSAPPPVTPPPSLHHREVNILRNLSHENIVKIVYIAPPTNRATFNSMYICFEAYDLDLLKLGRDLNQSLTVDHVRWFMYKLLKAVVYMSSAGIIHRDLKPGEVFVVVAF